MKGDKVEQELFIKIRRKYGKCETSLNNLPFKEKGVEHKVKN